MNKKIITIAGIVFSIIFVAVFIFVWSTSKNVISMEAENLNALYRAEVAFDISLFDNKLVSGQSVKNLQADMDKTGYTHSLNIKLEPSASSLNANKTYRSTLVFNTNGTLSKITFTEES